MPFTYTPLESAQQAYSDTYKDVYGFRPRFNSPENWNSMEFLYAEIDSLSKELVLVVAREREEQQNAIGRFEVRIQSVIDTGAADRSTALRWILQADAGEQQDWDYLCYLNGLPYGFFKEMRTQ